MKRPIAEDDWDDWLQWPEAGTEVEGGEEAEVESRKEVAVRVLRTDKGLKRMRIERVIETWTWPEV
jgi:hypothetical protein